ncbi:energy-coupling factor ABC transporter permease [Geobacter sp.]|uniref:energy-coupling factor ABC transporter permease n=1 Tax=Geobacter sp. TaxID=46610 RepID=UPI0026251B1F|nr:energy-coupling factor ABC transporter permease [Geobacter sp.]
MHMADALLSPAVGGAMWGAAAGAIAYCSRKVRSDLDNRRVPLMGVLGAFVFAAQMINFSIPGTGSSGHLGGGLLLTILLGPHAAFLVIASVLVVQALFFADGGLLALGCNIFNLGFFPAFVAYPLIYRRLVVGRSGGGREVAVTIAAAVAGLLLGALGVVLETVGSGVSALPLSTFVLMMLPIHLAIGVVEGVVTAAVVSFVRKARPEIVESVRETRPLAPFPMRPVLALFFVAALLVGGLLSRFASGNPDGLEWSIARVTGKGELTAPTGGLHGAVSSLQGKLALFPDYRFKQPPAGPKPGDARSGEAERGSGTSVAGMVGGVLTLLTALLIGFVLKRRNTSG